MINENKIENPYVEKRGKAWKKLTKLFPNKWKRKLAKSEGLYYNKGK